MQPRRPASSRAGKATVLLVAAATIFGWTSAMGAIAAKGVDHELLDGITFAVVALLGAAGAIGAMTKHRSRQAEQHRADEITTGAIDGADGSNAGDAVLPDAAEEHPEPMVDPVERACRELARSHGLSLRERDVLYLMATGITGKEIAARLTLSYNTVKSHIRHIYDKLDVHRKQDLADLIEQQKERLS